MIDEIVSGLLKITGLGLLLISAVLLLGRIVAG